MRQQMLWKKHRVELLAGRLHGASPAARLSGGYAFVTAKGNRPVTSVKQVEVKEIVQVTLADGSFTARIEEKKV